MSQEEQDQLVASQMAEYSELKVFRNRLYMEITGMGGLLTMLGAFLQEAQTKEARQYMDAKTLSTRIDFTKLKAMLSEYEAAAKRVDEYEKRLGLGS